MIKIKDLYSKGKRFIANIFFMFNYSWRLAKPLYVFASIKIIFNSIQPFILLIIPAKIIDELTESRRWDVVLGLILLMLSIELFIQIANMINSYISSIYGLNGRINNTLNYNDMWIHMDYEKLEDGTVRDLGHRVQSHISANGFIWSIADLITNIIQFVGYIYIVATLHPLIVIAIFLVIYTSSRVTRWMQKSEYEFQPVLSRFSRKLNYLFTTMIDFDYGKEIRINNASKWLNERFDKEVKEYMNNFIKRQHKELKYSFVSISVGFFQTILLYGYCSYKAISGLISIGSFSLYLGAITSFMGSFTNLISKINKLFIVSDYVEEYKIFQKIATPTHCSLYNPTKLRDDQEAKIEFCDVSFKYPNASEYALEHVSFTINPGERLSIVGYNGAGKTTLIKLITRLYKPTEGKILYNGVDINSIDYEEYLKSISIVFQDYKLFSMTIEDNIILNQAKDSSKLNVTIEQSGLKDKIQSLPEGLNTQLGRQFNDTGIEFSGGEGQKLACARAYYKDSNVVILDEPTASLDPLSEKKLYDRFNTITAGKTTIFISHRLASVKLCDKIAVFSNGKLVEYGTHSDLVMNKGVYEEMFSKQSEYYM